MIAKWGRHWWRLDDGAKTAIGLEGAKAAEGLVGVKAAKGLVGPSCALSKGQWPF